MYEFSMKLLGCFIICSSSLLFGLELSEVMLNAIDLDSATPHSSFFSPPNSLEFVTNGVSGVVSVLTSGTNPKILATIIKPIEVDMVYDSFVSIFHHEYFSVHENAACSSWSPARSKSNASIGIPYSAFTSCSPSGEVDPFKMYVVNDCNFAFVKHNFHCEPPKLKSIHNVASVKEDLWLSLCGVRKWLS